ncbi:MAG: class I mannose-6-phosphate isomerase [Treponema sp.]|nr:class I mannose-6-phosphate isomerase [Treponema sp.]
MSREIIFLNPVLKETIWGGSRLSEFGYNLPGEHVGECWAVSAHPNGDCTISSGTYAGMHLSQLWTEHNELFGNAHGSRFPLLTKIIDADADLSIQVHPDDTYAQTHENGSLGKTECWYILDAEPGTMIVIGHNAKNHEEVKQMIEQKRWKEFIREIPVQKGDFFLIEPGTVHAIKGGTLLLETQQNSDITYRVYDYDRLNNGKPRELHVKQSIDVVKAPFIKTEPPKDLKKTVNSNMHELVSCPFFSVWTLDVEENAEIKQDQKFMIVSVVEGSGNVDGMMVEKGKHFIIPAGYGKVVFRGNMQLVVSSI